MIFNLILGIIAALGGGAGFVYYLILFIQSYEVTTGSWGTEVSSNQDYMVAFFFFLMILLIGINQIVTTAKKKKGNIQMFTLELSIAMFVSSIYGLARLIKCYSKGKPVEPYFIWLSIALGCLVILLIWNNIHLRLIFDKKPDKKEEIPAKPEDFDEKPENYTAEPVSEEAPSMPVNEPSFKEEDDYEPQVIELDPEPKRNYRVRLQDGTSFLFDDKDEAMRFAKEHSDKVRFIIQ